VATHANPAGAGSANGGGSFVTGSSVTVTATANSGYTFANWTENGIAQSASASYSFTLAANRNLVANFTANPVTNTVATHANPANAGSVNGGGSFVTGSSVTVTATANSGYTFANWTENGIAQSAVPSYSFTLAANRNLVANFTANPVTNTVATSANPAGAGSVSGGGSFVTGSSVTVTATANSGYTFANWTENGIAQSASASYNFTLASNRNLVANFTANPVTNTVATSANPAGAGSVSGGGSFGTGSAVTVTATANSGYTFANWTENGIAQSASASYNFTLASNRNLVANFTANPVTNTVATSANPAGAGSVNGGGSFVTGSSVTVTATANSGYTFANWTENGIAQGTSAGYSFTLAANRNLVANFTANPVTNTVTTSANPAGAGSVNGGGSFVTGSSVTATATANSGYTFANWTENGIAQSASPSYNFTLAANRNLVANFTANPVTNTVATHANPAGAGSVSGYGSYVTGSSVTVTATANRGYTFANWTENGIAQSASASYSFTLATNRNLVANFTANPVINTVATHANPAGSGSVNGGGSFVTGSSVTVTATANSGYTFANWTENGIAQSASASYNFTLATNRNLVANFTANPVTNTVATSANPAGAGSVNGGGSFVTGSAVTVTATANSGYTFANWTENGIAQSAVPSYNFTLAANRNLVANFTANPVTNTVATSANPAGSGSVNGGGAFVTGSSVTVTATANSGYTFANWTENGIAQSTSLSYSFTLAANRNLVANFTANPVTNTVATHANPAGSGSVNGGGFFVTGSSVTVTATANSGYTFANWTENGIAQSASASYSFTLAANRNLVANFTANPVTNTVATSANPAGAGSVSGYGSFVTGSSVTVTATAGSSYTFANWTENGIVQSASSSFSFTIAANRNLVANFTTNPNVCTVTASAGTNGTISSNARQTVAKGGSVTFTATPARDCLVQRWLVNGKVAQTGGAAYTLKNVTSNDVVAVTFVTNADSQLTVLVGGNGSVTPKLGGRMLKVGNRYSLLATAAKGCLFSNWTSNGVAVAGGPEHTFLMRRDLVLQANFVTNPFIGVAGRYQGLFYDTNTAAQQSSGSCNATVTSNGTFTAKLQLGLQSFGFSGRFSFAGQSFNSIARPGLPPLTVQLQLGLSDNVLTGQVSEGNWTAELMANPVTWSKANPAPQAGKYTLVIPGADNSAAQPGGDGFGSVTVNSAGNVSFSGVLADGTAFSSAAVVTGEGLWPFYAPLYAGKGSIIGWLAFATNGDISGQLNWIKPAQPAAKYYRAGFTNSTEAIGSAYRFTNGVPVLGFTDGQLTLAGGNLPGNFTHQIEFGGQNQILDLTDSKPAFTVAASTGLLTGSVVDPQTGKAVTVKGIILQNQEVGAGFFLGTNQSGQVLLAAGP